MKILIYGVLAGVVVLAGLRLLSRKLLYYPVSLEPGREAALAGLGDRVTTLSVDAGEGVTLRGWCIEKDVDTLPFIFYFGGNAEEVSLNIEEFLAHVPANVVLVNYRGYGQSSGKPREADLKSDSLAIWDAVTEKYGISPSACMAWGRSLGSSVAAYLAKERALGGLILTCPFDSIEAVAGGFYPAWLVGLLLTDPHRTLAFSPAITCRTLILAAEDDEIIPFERTRTLYESLTCPKQLEVVRGAGHNTISGAAGYYGQVQVFLRGMSAGEK